MFPADAGSLVFAAVSCRKPGVPPQSAAIGAAAVSNTLRCLLAKVRFSMLFSLITNLH